MAVLAKLMIAASIVLPLQAQAVSGEVASHARAGQEAERRNDFATAVQEYSYVVAQLPRSAEMQSNLGIALYFNHELTRALPVLQKAMALNPELLAPHLFCGLAWYRLSNPDAAVAELETAARLNPSDVIAHTWLGYAYSAQSRYGAALKEFEAASRLDPKNIDVEYALGQMQLEAGKAATLELLGIAPDGGRTWQLAGEQAQLQGDRQDALADFLGAFQRRPDIAELPRVISELGGTVSGAVPAPQPRNPQEDVLYQRAHEAEQEARAAFAKVVEIAPASYRAHQILGDSLTAEQRLEEATGEYRTVLKLNPDLPGIHESIGKNLLATGKEAEALEEFQAELEIQPNSATATMYAGEVLLLMGSDEKARTMLNRALHLDRPPPETYRCLGKIELHTGNYRGAINELNHYISVRNSDASAYYLLSKAYQAVGDKAQMNRALAMFEKTSQNAKARSRVQAKLESSVAQNQLSEEKMDLPDSAAHQ